jgi:hypothetical protein
MDARGMGQGAGHGSSEVAQIVDVDHPIGTVYGFSTNASSEQRDNANATPLTWHL